MGRRTKAPGQKGSCPDLHHWSVAKVELQGGRGLWGSMASQPLSPRPQQPILHRMVIESHPFMVQKRKLRPRTVQGCAFSPLTLIAVAASVHEAQTPLLAALLSA